MILSARVNFVFRLIFLSWVLYFSLVCVSTASSARFFLFPYYMYELILAMTNLICGYVVISSTISRFLALFQTASLPSSSHDSVDHHSPRRSPVQSAHAHDDSSAMTPPVRKQNRRHLKQLDTTEQGDKCVVQLYMFNVMYMCIH